MITYSSKLLNWLQHTLVGTSSDKKYRHSLLKEDLTQHSKAIKELRQYVQDAHEDARRHRRELAGYSLNPFETNRTDDPAKGYPETLHTRTLKGYFGEIFAAIIAQNFSPFELDNWEVPVFLFRHHLVESQQLEAMRQQGGEAKYRPGRTGDDCLAFQRDENGEIARILYCEAKCTADHDSGMIADAYEKASKSAIVDLMQVIEVLEDQNTPFAQQWVE